MSTVSVWDKANLETKERVVRVLNKEVFSLGAVTLPGLPEFERYKRRLLTGADLRAFVRKRRMVDRSLQEKRDLLNLIENWRKGAALPHDLRTCRYKRCSRFLLVRGSRSNRVYCSKKCGKDYRALKATNKRKRKVRVRKLKRVVAALKAFRHLADWKKRVAHRAQVTQNFISYAIRRGELNGR